MTRTLRWQKTWFFLKDDIQLVLIAKGGIFCVRPKEASWAYLRRWRRSRWDGNIRHILSIGMSGIYLQHMPGHPLVLPPSPLQRWIFFCFMAQSLHALYTGLLCK